MSLISIGCHDAQPPPAPNFDALAASFGALSVAVAIGSILVGLLAIVVTVVWNINVKSKAVEAARETAGEVVMQYLSTPDAKKLFAEGAATHLASTSTGQGAPNPLKSDAPITKLRKIEESKVKKVISRLKSFF